MLLADGLTLSAAVGWVAEADFDDVGGADAGDLFDVESLEGERFANVPDYTAQLSLDYITQLRGDLRLRLYGDIRFIDDYVSSYSSDPLDSVDGFTIDSYTLSNASIGLESSSWSATLFVNNVFDEDSPISRRAGSLLGSEPKVMMLQPRNVGVRLNYFF